LAAGAWVPWKWVLPLRIAQHEDSGCLLIGRRLTRTHEGFRICVRSKTKPQIPPRHAGTGWLHIVRVAGLRFFSFFGFAAYEREQGKGLRPILFNPCSAPATPTQTWGTRPGGKDSAESSAAPGRTKERAEALFKSNLDRSEFHALRLDPAGEVVQLFHRFSCERRVLDRPSLAAAVRSAAYRAIEAVQGRGRSHLRTPPSSSRRRCTDARNKPPGGRASASKFELVYISSNTINRF
jgi:hypothetical protein